MRRFEFAEGTSNKFWNITLDGASFTVSWGRIGTAGQSQVKTFPTEEKAKAEHDKLVIEKTKKGYAEVGGDEEAPPATVDASEPTADAEPSAAPTAPAPPKAPVAPKQRAPRPPPPPPPESDGWVDGGGGYMLTVREGKIIARNDKGKELASLPKGVKGTDPLEQLEGAVDLLATHAAECRDVIETWMLRSLSVPRAVLVAVWPDPDWRVRIADLVVEAAGVTGILRAVDAEKGLGVVDIDGETRWSNTDRVAIPHPILLGDLDDWRSLLMELGATQGTPQLFRETFVRTQDAAALGINEFAGGNFALLAAAMGEARRQGYRVSAGCAVCRVWEGGTTTEARYEIGSGDPMYETKTGQLWWVDARQQLIEIGRVGPVAFSEGMRMAAGIYGKRTVDQKEGEDV